MPERIIAHSRAIVFSGMAGASVILLLLLLVNVIADSHESRASAKVVTTDPSARQVAMAKPDTQQYLDGLTAKKRRFVTILSSAIEHQNQQILAQRQQLLEIFSRVVGGAGLSAADMATVTAIATEYDLKIETALNENTWTELFHRVDAIPPSLVLSQAAKESGWGTSRLARQNNNYFGERCFARGCGVVPPQRQPGTTHEIADFDSVEASVGSYFHNINTHSAYAALRKLRMQLRLEARPLEGALLADGLHRYSTLGVSYIRDVKSLIRSNKLDQLDQTMTGGAGSSQLLSSTAVGNRTEIEVAVR